ncbi:NACHT, LRR and PYD domains-containing protein 12-like isoform X1 [Macaca fascicularis]|uniref:NACHT, LRR and PYD domains-containing protein 12-like isoform X1 n=1 Tax=Macaca fascicularis TaxID=9541 RepID=UPI0032B05CC2
MTILEKGIKPNFQLVVTLLYIYFITEASRNFRSFQLCSLPVSQLHLLCQALRNPYCKIKDLRFFRRLISSSCGALAAVLSSNQWLTELEFSETKLEASALKLLCEGLKDTNCKLQKLKLCASLLPEGSEAVCRYLSCVLICNPDLTELDPSENPLGDIGVKYLCVGLRHSNCKVEKLDLSTCHSTDASCVELSSFLQVSQALKELFCLPMSWGTQEYSISVKVCSTQRV